MSYYQILNVDPHSTFEDIKKSYRTLSFKNHPDKNPGNSAAEEKFKKINEAYETLKDNTKRKQYDFDLFLKDNETKQHELNDQLNDILGGLFQNISKMSNKPSKKKSFMDIFSQSISEDIPHEQMDFLKFPNVASFDNKNKFQENVYEKVEIPDDIIQELTITFNQAFNGCCLPVEISREIRNGNKFYEETELIYIDIPKGIDNKELIILEKKGHIIGNEQSNLKIQILLAQHDIFTRDGMDLLKKIDITFKESICGFKFVAEHLNGEQLKLNSSRGNVIQNGDRKIIPNLGFKRGERCGNLIIEFNVISPKRIQEEKLKVLEEIL
jgi:DnaJ-class molecular chaperone